MSSLESSNQHEDILTEGSIAAEQPNIFKIDILCVFARLAGDESLEVVMENKEEKEMYQNIKKRQDQNFILMEDEATVSHKENQKRVHTHFTNGIAKT